MMATANLQDLTRKINNLLPRFWDAYQEKDGSIVVSECDAETFRITNGVLTSKDLEEIVKFLEADAGLDAEEISSYRTQYLFLQSQIQALL